MPYKMKIDVGRQNIRMRPPNAEIYLIYLMNTNFNR